MPIGKLLIGSCTALLAASCLPAVALAADDFAGQTVTFILGSTAGGGYDSYVRPIVQYMGRHLPGNPTMILQGMPGAGGITAGNYIYHKAPKDGTVIGLISAAAAFEPLFGNHAALYDTRKFTWIGNINEIVGTCDVWASSGITGFDDILKREVNFGSSGAGSANTQIPTVLKNILGAKIRLVKGYSGVTEINLAMQRGEVAGSCGISLAALKTVYSAEYFAGHLKPILQLGFQKNPDLPGVAHIYDYARNDEERAIFEIIFGRYVLGRPILAPPDLKPGRADMLRAAFMATMTDPEFLADAKRLKLEIEPTSGEQVEALITRIYSHPASIVARATAAME
jgi:tripartite-type tricarboxylate transporter receptor subunit TctC